MRKGDGLCRQDIGFNSRKSNVCTHDCNSLWIKASAKWPILLYISTFLGGPKTERMEVRKGFRHKGQQVA